MTKYNGLFHDDQPPLISQNTQRGVTFFIIQTSPGVEPLPALGGGSMTVTGSFQTGFFKVSQSPLPSSGTPCPSRRVRAAEEDDGAAEHGDAEAEVLSKKITIGSKGNYSINLLGHEGYPAGCMLLNCSPSVICGEMTCDQKQDEPLPPSAQPRITYPVPYGRRRRRSVQYSKVHPSST